jgi:hypothetical protein
MLRILQDLFNKSMDSKLLYSRKKGTFHRDDSAERIETRWRAR